MDGANGTPTEATIDHCYHGLNLPLNLLPVCRRCNSSKGQRHIYDFYSSSDKFTEELWTTFVREFTESLINKKLTDTEVEQMKVNFKNEAEDGKE
ncbi:hypothetical protein [Bacillus sp. AFS017336]|uniref:hypothetical protein n=1 Tax=Bacillus sp. AFS017336 TaxID=2033489 RepID=UPI0011559C14|nr:hypothetical protein [Bacillus sp. AFS017336]